MTISNEAVESAAWAMRDLYAQEVCELPVESFFKEARAALEAVAPIIRAEALVAAADWLHGEGGEGREEGTIGLWLRGRAKGERAVAERSDDA